MKKRMAVVLLTMTLALSLFGCGSGNSGAAKQEEGEAVEAVEQEEQQQEAGPEQESEIMNEQETETEETEVPAMSGEYAEQTQKINDAMALIDESKTYNSEEFYYLMQDICEVLGTNYTTDIMKIEPAPWDREIRLNLNGGEMKKIFEEDEILWFILEYVSGDPLDAFIAVPEGAEGEFTARLYFVPHSDER